MLHNFSGRKVSNEAPYDVVFHNAVIYDGSGSEPFVGQVGVRDDKIAFVGTSLEVDKLCAADDLLLIDCEGKYSLAPGTVIETTNSYLLFLLQLIDYDYNCIYFFPPFLSCSRSHT
jgi:hypothetical protein